MKWSLIPTLTLASILSAVPSYAFDTSDTGNGLLANCSEALSKTSTDWQARSFCQGVIRGTGATFGLFVEAETPKTVCIPDKVTIGQTVRIVVQYMKAHPAYLHRDQELLIIWALRDAFPCQPPAR